MDRPWLKKKPSGINGHVRGTQSPDITIAIPFKYLVKILPFVKSANFDTSQPGLDDAQVFNMLTKL